MGENAVCFLVRALWPDAVGPHMLRHWHRLDLLYLSNHASSILLRTCAARASWRNLAQMIHEILPVHVFVLNSLLDGLQLLQLALPLPKPEEFLGIPLDLERIYSVRIGYIVQPPVGDLRQDHVGERLILFVYMIVKLRHLETVGVRFRVDAAHRATRQALGRHVCIRATNLRVGVQAESEVARPLHVTALRTRRLRQLVITVVRLVVGPVLHLREAQSSRRIEVSHRPWQPRLRLELLLAVVRATSAQESRGVSIKGEVRRAGLLVLQVASQTTPATCHRRVVERGRLLVGALVMLESVLHRASVLVVPSADKIPSRLVQGVIVASPYALIDYPPVGRRPLIKREAVSADLICLDLL